MKKLLFLFFAAVAYAPLSCQTLKLKKPLVYYTLPATGGLCAAGYIYSINARPFTTAELQLLDISTLGRLDRLTAYKSNATAKVFSDISAFTLAAVPTAMSLTPRIRSEFITYNTVYAQCLLSTSAIAMFMKRVVGKTRPYAYNPNISIEKRLQSEARLSFPSMHTAVSAAACFYAATTYSLYYPESDYKIPVWVGAALLPFVTGYLRNQSGRHFYSDIAAGYAIGAINGIVFPMIFKVRKK